MAAANFFHFFPMEVESDCLPDPLHMCSFYFKHKGKCTLVHDTTKPLANSYCGRPGGRVPRITLVY